MNLTEVTDLTSIGTLFSFILVSGGILVLNRNGHRNENDNGFKVPYLNSRYYLMPIWLLILLIFVGANSGNTTNNIIVSIDLMNYIKSDRMIPYLFFTVIAIVVSVYAVRLKWSLIPVLGLLTNLYLMSELGITNWMRFGIWLAIGLVLYFTYGSRKSRLNHPNGQD
jgi:hypothetical protein